MDADWKLTPWRGLGRLTFGLTPEEVAALAPIYGEPSPVLSHAYVAKHVEEVIARPDSNLTPDIIALMRESAADMLNFASQNLTLEGRATVLLDYRDLRLVGVACEDQHRAAHFEGRPVYDMKSRDVVALFERANGRPGRYRSTETAFDSLAVSLHAFCHTSRTGEFRFLDAADEDFNERSVTLRREPYRPANEMDQFFTVSVL